MSGTLRIHFTPQDLLLTQLARQPDPMWDAVLGVQVLTTANGLLDARLRAWKAGARRRMDSDIRAACRLLTDLAPATATYFPDFLTPLDASEGLDAGLDALRSTPRSRVARELAVAAGRRQLPRWTGRLADADGTAMAEVSRSFEVVHEQLIRPEWTRVTATVEMDRARRLGALEHGFSALLSAMAPFTWKDPVLSAPYPMDWDIRLRGRGICFVPSYFCDRLPVAIVDPHLPPVVVYPLQDPPDDGPGDAALDALLGANRARVLAALRTASTTGAVARLTGLRDSVVSNHLKVLRNAGLIDSERRGTHVVHTVTARGSILLRHDNPN
ncbi:helix-turn-helix domain-containing protein [Streptomyces sp. NPDC050418]|uniref:ArsR/SmtB family transcription factor n=1 Tax=Streptomyces sp. NPDC050418 TaxID=3365612 RepID=UPI00379EA200